MRKTSCLVIPPRASAAVRVVAEQSADRSTLQKLVGGQLTYVALTRETLRHLEEVHDISLRGASMYVDADAMYRHKAFNVRATLLANALMPGLYGTAIVIHA